MALVATYCVTVGELAISEHRTKDYGKLGVGLDRCLKIVILENYHR